jgi:hypothetical protein
MPGLEGWARPAKIECFRGEVRFAKYALADFVGELVDDARRALVDLQVVFVVSAVEGDE